MNDNQQMPPDDNTAARSQAIDKQKRAIAEEARLAKEEHDAKKANKDRIEREKAKAKELERIAKNSRPAHPLQQEVTHKLTDKVTEQIGALIRYSAAHNKVESQWVSASKAVARDVMQRAYPLALQMGIMGVTNDKYHTLDFANGSRIEFTWPGKEMVPSRYPAEAPAGQL